MDQNNEHIPGGSAAGSNDGLGGGKGTRAGRNWLWRHVADARLQNCKLVFPLRIALEAPSLQQWEAKNLLRTTQHALDDINEFSNHHLRLQLRNVTADTNEATTPVDGSAKDTEEETALVVKLVPAAGGSPPRAELQPYDPILEIHYAPNHIPSSSSSSSLLATFIARELQKIYAEEQASLADILSSPNSGQQPPRKSTPSDLATIIAGRRTRTFRYAPTYHLTFSLFTPTSSPSAWDIESVITSHLNPLLDSLSGITNFTVDTQVQLYGTFSPTFQPSFDEASQVWNMRKDELGGFINAADWPLSPSHGEGPTINFLLYVPSPSQSPLTIAETKGHSWLIPQWGGIYILNGFNSSNSHELSAKVLEEPMSRFSHQLLSLLGLPATPQSLPLRISSLTRFHTASLILSSSSTLGALARLTKSLPTIAIPESVATSVTSTIDHLHQACAELREGRFAKALDEAREADGESEKAFFEKSMVGQVYFPDEHKVAVYLPLLGPITLPLVFAIIKDIMQYKKSLPKA